MGIAFQYDEDYIPPVWPLQVGKQQMMSHLDFAVKDKKELEATTEKALQLGAKVADEQSGHPFCFVVWG